MDSTTAVEKQAAARSAKRARRPTTPPDAGDDAAVDLISGLDDDVLLRVLSLLPDASDAVRTGALSRRWRGLWTRVAALRFAPRPGFTGATTAAAGAAAEQRAAIERYAAFIDGVVARRAQSGCAIESLSIVYTTSGIQKQRTPAYVTDPLAIPGPTWWPKAERDMQQLMPSCVRAARCWICNAFRHGVKSFVLDLRLPPAPPPMRVPPVPPLYSWWGYYGDEEEEEDVLLLDGLPCPDRLETLHLALGDARLRLPSTVKFASLAHLSLERINITTGGAHLLGRLVSSASCPHLQKLRMRNIYLRGGVNEEMRIEANVLSELWIDTVAVLTSLKLTTPRLRALHMYECSYEVLTISAPRLEELAISFQPNFTPRWLEKLRSKVACCACEA
ncbi:hypothetical protein HU200_015497 [Digitaria exilis]|uniref:F-box domain-containing protein n=1 Tax=Digitaria exilis TaxID=1010633 RepID=A0A835FBA7_9POAL|nr:hypothetical protein HU200_015497 [Digitaria exilis]